jgi:predicted nucleotidyltransferase
MPKRDRKLEQITALLKREFKPSRLFLFGSQAAGTARLESDYDFVMVLRNYKGSRMRTWEKCRDLIFEKYGILADVFTYSESQFERSKKEFSSIAETAFNTGKEIDLGAP